MSYWKKLLREAGIDWKDLKQVTSVRKEWRRIVKERMNRLDMWEKIRGYKWESAREKCGKRRCEWISV